MSNLERIDQLMLGAKLGHVINPKDRLRIQRERKVVIPVGAHAVWAGSLHGEKSSIVDTSFKVTVTDLLTEELGRGGIVLSTDRRLITQLPLSPQKFVPNGRGGNFIIPGNEDLDGPVESREELRANFRLAADGSLPEEPPTNPRCPEVALYIQAQYADRFYGLLGRLEALQAIALEA